MANKLGWFAARTTEDLVPILKNVRRRAADADVPDAFRVVRAPDPTPFTSVMLYGWQFHGVYSWAQAVSQEVRGPSVAFFIFEGTWNYAVFDSGDEVLRMDVYSSRTPTLWGDVARAASLFGVHPELFLRYHAAIEALRREPHEMDEAMDDESDEPAAVPFSGDRYAPDDEWAHLDFARRLGNIVYPEPDAGVELGWDETDRARNASWVGLGARLPPPPGSSVGRTS